MRTDTGTDTTITDEDDAELGAPAGTQTPGDDATARQPKEGDQPADGSDTLVAENDPLVLARKGSKEAVETAPPAKDKAVAATAKPDDGEGGQDEAPPADGKAVPEDDEAAPKQPEATNTNPLLNAQLEPETWSKLSHKDKSLFLGLRNHARKVTEEVEQTKAEVVKAKRSYETIERFVADQGLNPEAYRNAVIIAGLAAKDDARALPALEETVKRLRQKAGIVEQPPAPPAPAVDHDELMAAITEAEESFDFAKVKALVGKLKAPAKSAPPPPAAPPAKQQQQNPPPGVDPDAVVNEAIAEYLTESGVPEDQVISHLQGLIKKNPGLANVPVAARVRAVMKAHSAARAPAIPPKRVQTPISGRGRTAGGGSANDRANQDPLVLARRGRAPT